MTEYTDKASQKSGKAAPGKQPAKSRSPKGKRAKAPGGVSAPAAPDTSEASPEKTATKSAAKKPASRTAEPKSSDKQAATPAHQPLDPATITFGSNRPIVATPQKLPESSGLRFSGSSAGELKSSGPQPSSPKASGLTFSTSTTPGSTSTTPGSTSTTPGSTSTTPGSTSTTPGSTSTTPGSTSTTPGGNGQPAGKPTVAKPGGPRPAAAAEAKAPESRKAETTKAEPSKPALAAGAKTTTTTKPAIAPQASGRRLAKERSSSGFVVTLVSLAVVVGGLAVWMNQQSGPAAPAAGPAPAAETNAASVAPSTPETETPEPIVLGPSLRAPMRPGPLAALPGETPASSAAATGLTTAEIREIQQLLSRLELAPGNTDGVLTVETTAAIRSYQEMAGLPGDGEANLALLEELRAVVELYGG